MAGINQGKACHGRVPAFRSLSCRPRQNVTFSDSPNAGDASELNGAAVLSM